MKTPSSKVCMPLNLVDHKTPRECIYFTTTITALMSFRTMYDTFKP